MPEVRVEMTEEQIQQTLEQFNKFIQAKERIEAGEVLEGFTPLREIITDDVERQNYIQKARVKAKENQNHKLFWMLWYVVVYLGFTFTFMFLALEGMKNLKGSFFFVHSQKKSLHQFSSRENTSQQET